MPRCYMVKKQINKYQNSNREFWDEGVASNASPDSPTEACVAPNYYNPPSSQPNNSEEPTESHLKKNEPPPPPPPPPLPPPPPPSDIFRSRSIEETEAAHDLLSLSQSLPPLPAPGAVTIHQTIDPVTAATHYYSPLTPDANPSPPISVPIPCYQQAPIVYVVQVPTVPTVPTPPTSECSSDAENQLLSLSSAAEAFVKQQQHPQQGQVQHVIYGGEGGKQEEIFIMPLSPEPERQQEVVVTTATVGTETDAEGVEIVGKVIPGGLCIPDKRTKKLCRKRADRMHGEQEEVKRVNRTKFYTVTDEVENEEDYDDSEISPTLTANLEVKTLNRYVCNECGKKYATSSNLSRHKQTHRSLDSQSARKCMTCGKAYVSMPALAMHVLTHKLAHSCGICGKQFSRPWLLQGHLRSHSGEKPYGCAHCGKAFADRSNLRAHMQTHSQDKKFRCTNCRKTFALKSYLNKHQESACQATDEKEEEVKVVCTVGTNTNM